MARVTTHPGFPRTVELYACGLGISKKNTVKNVLVWTIHDTFTPYTANHLEAPRKGHPHWHSCLPASLFLRQCICVAEYFTEACKCKTEGGCRSTGQIGPDKPDLLQPMLFQGPSLALETQISQVSLLRRTNSIKYRQL